MARVPDSDPRMVPRNLRLRAYQLVEEPESAVTIASSGMRWDSSWTTRIGLTGSASTIACCSIVSSQEATFRSIFSLQPRRPRRSSFGMSADSVAPASPTRLTSVG